MRAQTFHVSSQKKKPSLDLIASKRSFSSRVHGEKAVFSHVKNVAPRRGMDGIRSEGASLLKTLKKRSFKDSLVLFLRRGEIYVRRAKRIGLSLIPDMAPQKMVYASIVSGIVFGMASMTFITHSFGTGVFARSSGDEAAPEVKEENVTENVAGNYNPDQDIFFEYFTAVSEEKYEENIREMVKGYPIEAMLPYIFEQDRLTAAFLIGIAKKESNWGKRIPVLEGQDCFNYWGYRGVRRMMGTGGHTCFNSRQDAVKTVATRLDKLIHSEQLNTPEKLIVWKCGFSCEGHSRESVKKWIADVDMYYQQAIEE